MNNDILLHTCHCWSHAIITGTRSGALESFHQLISIPFISIYSQLNMGQELFLMKFVLYVVFAKFSFHHEIAIFFALAYELYASSRRNSIAYVPSSIVVDGDIENNDVLMSVDHARKWVGANLYQNRWIIQLSTLAHPKQIERNSIWKQKSLFKTHNFIFSFQMPELDRSYDHELWHPLSNRKIESIHMVRLIKKYYNKYI